MTIRISLLVLVLAASTARADALDSFLEQRVAEELAADGTLLSRLGVTLDIEIVGDKVIVSLIDPATRRAVASTKLDSIPADREAAVASVTQVAANLATQLRPPATGATAIKDVLQEDRAERDRRAELAARYRAESIRFGHLYVADTNEYSGGTTVTHSLIPYKGDRRLKPDDFFLEVGRPDLAERVRNRRMFGYVAGTVGLAATFVGGYIIGTKGHPDFGACEPFDDACSDAQDREASKHLKRGFAITGVGLATMLVGGYFVFRANPVGEREMHDLADEHNAKVKQRLEVTPYAGPSGGGVSVVGRF